MSTQSFWTKPVRGWRVECSEPEAPSLQHLLGFYREPRRRKASQHWNHVQCFFPSCFPSDYSTPWSSLCVIHLYSPPLSPHHVFCTSNADIKLLTVNLRVGIIPALSPNVHFVYTREGKVRLKEKNKKISMFKFLFMSSAFKCKKSKVLWYIILVCAHFLFSINLWFLICLGDAFEP